MKTKIEQDRLKEQIREIEAEIKKLLDRKAWLEAQLAKIRQMAEDYYNKREKELKLTLRPLEEAK